MKKILTSFLIIGALANSACTPSKISAGEEGVVIKQPFFFGSEGVSPTPITSGLDWTAFSTKVERYNIKPLKYKESFIDLTASDNVAIDFDSYVTLQAMKGKTPILHEISGKNWYANNIQDYYRQLVRNEFRTRTSIELRTDPNVINQTQQIIKEQLEQYVSSIGIPIKVIKVVTGKVNPPEEVLAEAERTAAEKQKNETQIARANAEKERAKAEKESALADKAYAIEFNMTTEQFLINKRLDTIKHLGEKKSTNMTVIMNASDAKGIFNTSK